MPPPFPIAYASPDPDQVALLDPGWFPDEADAIRRFAADADLSLTDAERLAGSCLRAGWQRVSYTGLLDECLTLEPPFGSPWVRA